MDNCKKRQKKGRVKINKDPWSMPTFIISEIVSIGIACSNIWIKYGTKYIWIPLSIGLVLAFFYYGNAVFCCMKKDEYIISQNSKAEDQSQLTNLSNRVSALESHFEENQSQGGLRPHD